MEPPEDVTTRPTTKSPFGDESAGIELRRACTNNLVSGNTTRGVARTALALTSQSGLNPKDNVLVLSDVMSFTPAVRDVLITAGVTNTLIIGQPRSIDDLGAGTVTVPR
jgi:hypothetical protein